MEILLILFIVGLVGVTWFIGVIRFRKHNRQRSHFDYYNSLASEDILPNGYISCDNYDQGYTDFEVKFWGLDQPAAPEPSVSAGSFGIWLMGS